MPGEGSPVAKSLDLAALLLDFHMLMCIFEKKADYVERSIAQTQALIDFNLNATRKKTGDNMNHLEMLRDFGSRWNEGTSVGFGNEQWDTSNGVRRVFELEPPELSGARFEEYIQTCCVTSLDKVNPLKRYEVKDTSRTFCLLLLTISASQRQTQNQWKVRMDMIRSHTWLIPYQAMTRDWFKAKW